MEADIVLVLVNEMYACAISNWLLCLHKCMPQVTRVQELDKVMVTLLPRGIASVIMQWGILPLANGKPCLGSHLQPQKHA